MTTKVQEMIKIEESGNSRIGDVDFDNIAFGKVFSDHMFEMDYEDGEWKNLTVRPYQNLSLSPATSVLHYGQAIFEGMKAYKNLDGEIFLFRPRDNANRMNASARRLCMPEIPREMFIEGLLTLIKKDSDWVPGKAGFALYIRPFMIATDDYIGVKPSKKYKFLIFTCPVGAYYSEPLKVKIEQFYSRAAEGGIGRTNYAASLYPAMMANKQGYHQLIWTDAKEHKYIEESGTMNVMFVVDNILYTPTTSGTILPGITRDSVLTLAKDWGMEVQESSIHVEELITALKEGRVQEAFGTGTAATIARISIIGLNDTDYSLPPFSENDFSIRVAEHLEDIKRGKIDDKFGWITKIDADSKQSMNCRT
jgi:branched-chain amino acid aminotransferase